MEHGQGSFMTYKSSYNVQSQYEWSRKGKSYKTKYFKALKELMGAATHDKECQSGETKETMQRTAGADQIRRVAEEK